MKPSQTGRIPLPFSDVDKLCTSAYFNISNMSINVFSENKTLAKISDLRYFQWKTF